jgi:ribosomal protein S27E
MLERIDKLVFYFTIECANCRNVMKVSHVVVEEKAGEIYCSLCGKDVKVPNHEELVTSAKTLNSYLGDSLNSKYVNLVMNEKYEKPDSAPPAH